MDGIVQSAAAAEQLSTCTLQLRESDFGMVRCSLLQYVFTARHKFKVVSLIPAVANSRIAIKSPLNLFKNIQDRFVYVLYAIQIDFLSLKRTSERTFYMSVCLCRVVCFITTVCGKRSPLIDFTEGVQYLLRKTLKSLFH